MPKHQIGAGHRDDVGAGLAIGMRIDAGAHQGLDRDQIAADLARGVGDHAGGGDDLQNSVVGPQGRGGEGRGRKGKAQKGAAWQAHRSVHRW